jgi:hypothetical protein
MKIGIYAVAVVLLATGAMAEPPEDGAAEQAATASPSEQVSTAAAETEAAPQEEKKICRTEKATGSLTRRHRICMTQAQWREIYDRTRRGVGELQGSASGSPACLSAMDAACGAPGPGGTVGVVGM